MNTSPSRVRVTSRFHGTFGSDEFGRRAEAFARYFGTPRFLIGQTVVVAAWIIVNAVGALHHWDPYPFILLNLAFSLQAAYAAPLILLAQTRQADRDRETADIDNAHRERLAAAALERQEMAEQRAAEVADLIRRNTELTEEIRHLSLQIHALVARPET